MNVGEAQDVQALLTYLLDPHALSDVAARDAAIRLCDRSRLTLAGGGLDGVDVARAWPDMLEGCPGCDDCLTADQCLTDDDFRPVETVRVGGGVL